jgi:hypothetical protein
LKPADSSVGRSIDLIEGSWLIDESSDRTIDRLIDRFDRSIDQWPLIDGLTNLIDRLMIDRLINPLTDRSQQWCFDGLTKLIDRSINGLDLSLIDQLIGCSIDRRIDRSLIDQLIDRSIDQRID